MGWVRVAAYHAPCAGHPARGTSSDQLTSSLQELEAEARHAIGEMAYAYFSGGAENERLLEENVTAWNALEAPSPGVGRHQRGRHRAPRSSGQPVSSPVVVAPTAIHGLAHPDGEKATALGAAAGAI